MSRENFADFKRCFDRYAADPAFREAADTDKNVMGPDGEEIYRAVRAILYACPASENPYYAEFVRRQNAVAQNLETRKSRGTYASEALYRYAHAEHRRISTECARIRGHKYVSYYPLAIELSDGCSVQCPFCGFAAEKHRQDFLYTAENARLFSDVVKACTELIGPIISLCPLYFATEPFDNPDYTRFLEDYIRLTGGVPQTTTAVADEKSDRVRELIKLVGPAALQKDAALRFSVRNLKQLERLENAYSPQETEYIEFLANNPESVHAYSESGKAKKLPDLSKMMRYSICCISGLLINFPRHTVSFITPEMPDEVYPKGYRLVEARTFGDGASFRRAADELLTQYIITGPGKKEKLCLNRNIRLFEENSTYIFKGDGVGYQLGKNAFTQMLVKAFQSEKSFEEAFRDIPLDPEGENKLYAACEALFERGYIRRKLEPQTCPNKGGI